MRFVQGKSAEVQASAVVFRTRDLLVRQRTQLINALRGHLTEFGYIVRQGVGHVAKLVEIVGDPASDVPAEARPVLAVIAESLQALQAQIALLDREIASRAKADPVAKRLMTVPGVGPVIAARSPPMSRRWARCRASARNWGRGSRRCCAEDSVECSGQAYLSARGSTVPVTCYHCRSRFADALAPLIGRFPDRILQGR